MFFEVLPDSNILDHFRKQGWKDNRQSLMQRLRNESEERKPNKNSEKEARQVNKPRMILKAVQSTENL